MNTHECPGGDCAVRVPRAQLACPRCWAKLPRDLQGAVNEAYKTRRTAPGLHLDAVVAAVGWYRDNT